MFIVGVRSDLGLEWSFPDPTHSQEALTFEQFVTGKYWERHRIVPPIETLASDGFMESPTLQPWRTVRDALVGLPDPVPAGEAYANIAHVHHAGARSYLGHTGSPLDRPSKTLKAGVHGVPGGENTICLDNGTVRYLTVREATRIQAQRNRAVGCTPSSETR